jgi:hypothetical protein
MEADAAFPQQTAYTYIHISLSSQLLSCPTIKGKTCHRPRRPTCTENVHKILCDLVPKVVRLRHSYHYPSAMQHSARYPPPCLA